MPRRWRGTITLENTQTGDGRVFAPGAIEWADLPLPLMWMVDGDSLHLDLATSTPQVGLIETITRDGDAIVGEGVIFDDTEEGAEVIRRLDAGEGPLGNRFPVSIDPDNWEVEILATDMEGEDEVLLIASGNGAFTRTSLRAAITSALRAAAGDPDPEQEGDEDTVTLFEDRVDSILERYTMLRIRGATLCNIAAFDGAYIELTDEAAAPATPEGEPEATTASAPARPPLAWFRLDEPEPGDDLLVQQLDGGWAVPLTITDDGQVFGHIARWDQSHRGYVGRHLPPPRSATAYREFHTGLVVCDDGTEMPTGALTVGADHARLELTLGEARDHYAHSAQGFADVRVVDGRFGPWACGALRPSVTDEDLRVLRALSPSGDWRPLNGHLELCAVLAVNVPGYPIAREAVAASALVASGLTEARGPRMRMTDGEVRALVSAGMVTRCSECAERARAEALRADAGHLDEAWQRQVTDLLLRLDRRTRHLEPMAASAIRDRIHVATAGSNGGSGAGRSRASFRPAAE